MAEFFIVLCRDDVKPDGSKGAYVIATRKLFLTREDADQYSAGINSSREAHVQAHNTCLCHNLFVDCDESGAFVCRACDNQ